MEKTSLMAYVTKYHKATEKVDNYKAHQNLWQEGRKKINDKGTVKKIFEKIEVQAIALTCNLN